MGGKGRSNYKQRSSYPYPKNGEGNSPRYDRTTNNWDTGSRSAHEGRSRALSHDDQRSHQQSSGTGTRFCSSRERNTGEPTGAGARGDYETLDHKQRERKMSESKENTEKLKIPKCYRCKEHFNNSSHVPRTLPCGHSLCIGCLKTIVKDRAECRECKSSLGDVTNLERFPANFMLLKVIEARKNEEFSNSDGREEKRLCKPKLENSKPVVTLNSNEPREDIHRISRNNDCSPSPERSPHNSMCLEAGIKPTFYCAVCLKWVCSRCGNIDHIQQKCCLVPKREALDQMCKAQLNGVEIAKESVGSTIAEQMAYEESLDSLSLAMQAAFESIATEKERVKAMRKEGLKKKNDLESAVEALPNSTNLPDALAALKLVEDEIKTTENWQKEQFCRRLCQEKVNGITKEILLSTVMMKSMAEKESRPSGQILAQHNVEGVNLYSQLVASGGRILAHALKKVNTVPVGSRAMSLTAILACLNHASSLTFLDIGWNGTVKERVFVRLIGDTLRGRQFLALCTGLLGPSFRDTAFHRIWWKGLPGEHVWGGDYSKNNGSGGQSLLKLLKVDDHLPQGLSLKITAGLVAGRYEKNDISSIFRIYTKGHECEELGAFGGFADNSEEDESGFGYVEHGLDVFQDAIRLGNIQEVTIFDCGIVIETN